MSVTNQLGIRNNNTIVPFSAGSMMPAGTIISYSGSIAGFTSTAVADSTTLIHKDGWAVCNGASIPFATYAQLYARLSTTWNTTTNPLTGSAQAAPADTGVNFRIPNLQGVFLRSVADYAGSDAYNTANDVVLGVYKADQFQGHKHAVDYAYDLLANDNTQLGAGTVGLYGRVILPPAVLNPTTDGTNGTPRTGFETAPKQIGVYYLVKLYDNLAPVDVFVPEATATVAGIVGTGAQSFAGVKTFNSAPVASVGLVSGTGNAALMCKKVDMTTGANQGDTAAQAHGLTSSKIVGISAIVFYNTGLGMAPASSVAAFAYTLDYDTNNITLRNVAANSANILSKPASILIWYTA